MCTHYSLDLDLMSVRPIQNFSIIIPVKRDDPFIERCIAAVLMSAPSGHEIIVVLDGWETSRLDHFLSHRNIRIFTHSSAGPAVCRHFGALQSVQDWLCFLDSDVLVRPDTFEKALCALHGSGDDGLIGSYDDLPEAPSAVSRFRNLLHHFHHQRNHGTSGVFWGAFGIVRRSAYLDVGGFDPRYRDASVEDIELGYRLAENGYAVRIRSEVQVCHLKRWTLKNMIHTDIWLRARPWARLMRKYRRWGHRPLNTSSREQLSAVLSCFTPISLAVGVVSGWMLWLSALSLILFTIIQWDFYQFARRHFSALRLPQVMSLHHIYFFSAVAGGILSFVSLPGEYKQLKHGKEESNRDRCRTSRTDSGLRTGKDRKI